MTSSSDFNTKKSSLRPQQAKPKPLQNKASMNQPAWVSQSTFFFKEASKYTILLGTFLLLGGFVSQGRYMAAVVGITAAGGISKAVDGISTAVGVIGTTVGGCKRNSQLDQENDEPHEMPPEEPQDRLDTQDATVDCLENGESQDSKNDFS